jgi:hypothetical protein
MKVLDKSAAWIRDVLTFLPPEIATFLWFPVLVMVVFLAAVLFFRRILPFIGRVGAALLPWLATLLGAALLLPDLIIATAFRLRRLRPPALLYHYGDTVVDSMIGLARASTKVGSALSRLARVHVLLLALACGALIWAWNAGHCSETSIKGTCVRPVSGWMESFGDSQTAPPAPKVTKTPNRPK